ncbi:uncharacterized protein [Macrobrachium rosenbergii]|uniref:uncharacterized protein n=1 Tax=Macrobrachium rosenbergii TaxID=79674 RepID=UPI0034D3FBD7
MNPYFRQKSVPCESSADDDTKPGLVSMICIVDSPKHLSQNSTNGASPVPSVSSAKSEDEKVQELVPLMSVSSGTSVMPCVNSVHPLSSKPAINTSGLQCSPRLSSSGNSTSVANASSSPRPHGSSSPGALPPEQTMKIPTSTMCQGTMNQMCKVCGEPAAGFHFGAFTCEGCKSFFGRTYNNMSSLNECKNSGRCIINKKTRTSCKSCRLRKCLLVGMSKSGSRYGRRSNWFKIHYLMQNNNNTQSSSSSSPSSSAGHESLTSDALTTAADISCPVPMGTPETRSLSSDLKGYKFRPEFKFSRDYDATSSFKSGLDLTNLRSASSSSTESHQPDSPLDLGGQATFSSFAEQFCPKDLLTLYSLPTLAPRLPAFMSQTSLAHRYLYPYYPSLFSAYSRQQYLSALLEEAKQRETHAHDADDTHDLQLSQLEEFTPPSKVFKPNPLADLTTSSSSAFEGKDDQCHLDIDETSSNADGLKCSHKDEDQASEPNLEGHTVTSLSTGQDHPMDLSTRNVKPTGCGENPLECDSGKKELGKTKDAAVIGSSKKEESLTKSKEEQMSPLDLSATKLK